MNARSILGWILAYGLAVLGGTAFVLGSLPLPWVLGAMAAIMVWNAWKRRPASVVTRIPGPLKNAALVVLGIVFGMQFTWATVQQVAPYLFPFIAVTALLIAACIGFGYFFAGWSGTDAVSSVFGFIPGGLSEMAVVGQSLGANPMVVIFIQTVRLLTVLSIVPFSITAMFAPTGIVDSSGLAAAVPSTVTASPSIYAFAWLLLPAAGGWLLRRAVPVPYVLVPMLVTAMLQMAGLSLPPIPVSVIIGAQLTIGLGLGESISFRDLKAMGKQLLRVLVFIGALLVLSMGGGVLLSLMTEMDLPTALLSIAPGGLIEMALTASSIGADPVVVTSLQMVRLYVILGAVPFLLKRMFPGKGTDVE